jgi:hypothetical protein
VTETPSLPLIPALDLQGVESIASCPTRDRGDCPLYERLRVLPSVSAGRIVSAPHDASFRKHTHTCALQPKALQRVLNNFSHSPCLLAGTLFHVQSAVTISSLLPRRSEARERYVADHLCRPQEQVRTCVGAHCGCDNSHVRAAQCGDNNGGQSTVQSKLRQGHSLSSRTSLHAHTHRKQARSPRWDARNYLRTCAHTHTHTNPRASVMICLYARRLTHTHT